MRKVLFLVMLLVLGLIVPVTAAQDQPTFCGGLSETDCADLTAYEEANAAVDSAAFELAFNLAMNMEGPNIAMDVTGSGAYSGAQALAGMAMDSADPMALLSADGIGSLIKAFSGDLDLTVNLPAEMTDGQMPSSVRLHVMLVEGIGYIDFDALAETVPGVPYSGWGGLDLIALIDQLGPMMESMMEMGMGNVEAQMGGMEQFADPAMFEEFIHITRAQDVAGVFMYSFDFGALMQNEMMRDLIEQQMEAMGTDMGGMDLNTLLSVYDNMTMSAQVQYNGDSRMLERVTFNMELDMSSLGVEGSMTMSGEITFSGHDATTITAPEDANIAPPEMLFGGMDM